MAQLWIYSSDTNEWQVAPLDGPAFAVTIGEASRLLVAPASTSEKGVTIRCVDAAKNHWVLMDNRTMPTARVNELPVLNGMRALHDRDLLGFDAGACGFFSTERPAAIEPFPGIEGTPAYCGRCRQAIAVDTHAVQCTNPACRVWHHQSDALPCWTHVDHCSMCDQSTALDGSFRWTPEDL